VQNCVNFGTESLGSGILDTEIAKKMSELCDKVSNCVELCDQMVSMVQITGPQGAEWCEELTTVEVTTGIV
jgi:hypothetical protein